MQKEQIKVNVQQLQRKNNILWKEQQYHKQRKIEAQSCVTSITESMSDCSFFDNDAGKIKGNSETERQSSRQPAELEIDYSIFNYYETNHNNTKIITRKIRKNANIKMIWMRTRTVYKTETKMKLKIKFKPNRMKTKTVPNIFPDNPT